MRYRRRGCIGTLIVVVTLLITCIGGITLPSQLIAATVVPRSVGRGIDISWQPRGHLFGAYAWRVRLWPWPPQQFLSQERVFISELTIEEIPTGGRASMYDMTAHRGDCYQLFETYIDSAGRAFRDQMVGFVCWTFQ